MEHESHAYYRALLDKYQRGEATEAEIALVHAYYRAFDARKGYAEGLDAEARAVLKTELFVAIQSQMTRRKPRTLRRWFPYAAAVAIFLAIGWLFLDTRDQTINTRLAATDIAPGGNRATLTLADGRTIDLSEAQTGIVIEDGITYLDGSAVFGEQVNEGASEPVQGSERNHKFISSQVHSLTTPKGGTYQITLPDGTKVWLNAASTLKYPSRFDGNERVVELEGEAYFEVRHQTSDTRQQTKPPKLARELRAASLVPFKVISDGQIVEVLGTQFNISAYPDDPETKTTLVEGKVRLRVGTTGASVSLVPGEQGILQTNGLTKQQVDVQQYTAWRNGRFSFEGKPFDAVMRELERWYDIDIRYEGAVPDKEFYGDAFRSSNLAVVLRMLESAELAYRMEGRTLTIINKQKRIKHN